MLCRRFFPFRKIHTESIPKIINEQLPVCSQCKFFRIKDATCSKFSEKSIITGEINYTSVYDCRREPNMCGKEGKLYSAMKPVEKLGKQVIYTLTEVGSIFGPSIIVFSIMTTIYISLNN